MIATPIWSPVLPGDQNHHSKNNSSRTERGPSKNKPNCCCVTTKDPHLNLNPKEENTYAMKMLNNRLWPALYACKQRRGEPADANRFYGQRAEAQRKQKKGKQSADPHHVLRGSTGQRERGGRGRGRRGGVRARVWVPEGG